MTPFRKLLLRREEAAFRQVSDLRDYQLNEAIPFMMDNPFSGVFMSMGLGKSVCSLTVLQRLFTRGLIQKTLVIAPLRVAVQTWPTEISEWSHTYWLSYTVIRADEKHPELLAAQKAARKAERQEELGSPNNAAAKAKTAHILLQKERLARSPAMIHIINREAVAWLVEYWGKKWPYDCVIIDESRSFSDHRTERFKALNRVRLKIKRMHLLSGLPAPEGIEDYFAQIYLLDGGERFGRGITKFREQYMIHQPYKHLWVPREGAAEQIAAKVSDICMVMREEDYLKRDKAITIERPILLDPGEMKVYRDFARELVLEIDDAEIEAENGAALAQKLLQMASGAVYDGERKWHRFHDHKLEELAQLREEANGSPLLVAYWHRSSLARIQKAFPKAIKMDRAGDSVVPWNKGEIDMLLIHPRSAGHGLNMQHGPGHTMVWFDNPLPLEDYLQTNKRLDRPGQKKIVRIYHLVTRGTIDAKVVPVLRDKDNAQDTVKRYIRDLREKWK